MLKQQRIIQEDNVTSSPGNEAESAWQENLRKHQCEGKGTIILRHSLSPVTGNLKVLGITK